MRRVYFFLVFLFLVSGLSAQLKKFTVEVPMQPKVKLSDSIQSVTILNRSLSPDFQNYYDDSLQVSFYRSNFKANRIILDSLASDTLIKTLGDMLFDSYRYDVVIPVERNISRFLNFNEIPDTLSRNFVKAMCELYNTDVLLVLENLAMRVNADYSRRQEYIYDDYYRVHHASIDVHYLARWRLYDPDTSLLLVNYTDVDTLYWDATEFDVNTLFANLPSVKQAAVETALFAARKFAELIAPSWVTETRYYFVLQNTEIDQSVTFAAEGEWGKALENWLRFTETGSKSLRGRIMFNVALAYEMTGDIENALKWIGEAQKIYYREVNTLYTKTLLERKSRLKSKNPVFKK
jgi:hypothetical protein